MIHLHHRNLIPVAVAQFTFAEVVPFPQRRQVLITQDSFSTGGKYRLLVRVAGREVVEGQVQHDGHDRRGADARVEDRREPAGKVVVEVRGGDRDHAETDGSGDDDQVDVVAV